MRPEVSIIGLRGSYDPITPYVFQIFLFFNLFSLNIEDFEQQQDHFGQFRDSFDSTQDSFD